jgi:hypothetical protein
MDQQEQEQVLRQHARKCAIESQILAKPIRAIKSIQEVASMTAMATLDRKFQRVPLV